MKIRFDKGLLVSAVIPAMGSVSSKNALSAVEGILFESDGDGECVLSAYDLEKGMRRRIEARVEEGGSYIIKADKLSSIIRAMPESEILIEVDKRNITHISSGRSMYELHAIRGEDFPNLPELSVEGGISVKQNELRSMLVNTMFAIAVNDKRPELNGEYFVISGGKITLVSCDSNRLAVMEKQCEITGDAEYSFILPGKSVNDLVKLLGDNEEPVFIRAMRKHVVFKIGETYFFSRLIDEKYIDYMRFIPKNSKTFVTIDRAELESSLSRALLVAEDTNMGQSKSPLRCSFNDDHVKLSSVSNNGGFNDEILIKKEGDDITIGFNCRYLYDAIKAASDCDTVRLSLSTPLMSMLIEPEGECESKFTFLALPVKIKE